MIESTTESAPAPDVVARWADAALRGEALSKPDAQRVLGDESIALIDLIQAAGRVRRHHFGHTVSVHVLDNVRNGACPEDCAYCGQSRVSEAPIQPWKLKPTEEILAAAKQARDQGAWRFCMALSGRGPSDGDIDYMCDVVRQVSELGLRTCLSSGLMDAAKIERLKQAGLDRLNHNLNTSRRHYPAICTTHTYDQRLATLRAAKDAGLGVCAGMIVGMGETRDDIAAVARELREIEAESIPVNFLLPIEGNPITEARCDGEPLTPRFVLRVLCLFRLLNPAAEIRVAAGREHHLRSLQPLALWPANSLFVEGYLLTTGSNAEATLRMILDAGFTPQLEEGDWPAARRGWAGGNPAARPADPRQLVQLRPIVQRHREASRPRT